MRRYAERNAQTTGQGQQMMTTVTQHSIVSERVTLLPESGLATAKIPTFLDKFSSPGSFSHVHEIINYIFAGLLFCNLYINIVNNYR